LGSLLSPWIGGQGTFVPTVFFPTDGPLTKEISRSGINCDFFPMVESLERIGDSPLGNVGIGSRFWQYGLALPGLAWTVWKWRKRFGKSNVKWIHSNGAKTHILASWSVPVNIPVFWHLHDFVGERPMVRKLLRIAWRPGIQALAISKAVADDFSNIVPKCPIRVWNNTIDTVKFYPENLDGSWLDHLAGFSHGFNGLRVGMVATYARWKGQDVFLRACSKILEEYSGNVRFYIIGGPVYQTPGSQWTIEDLEGMIQNLGLKETVGLIPFQSDTARVYQSLDVVVHASIRREPFGLVIGEAMACGKPVVAALRGGAAEVGRSGLDCLNHQPGDAESLSSAIVSLLNSEKLRDKIGKAARERIVNSFGQERIFQNWRELIGEI
jgi:glycosyltransferase involved in cell wall biosynthesis